MFFEQREYFLDTIDAKADRERCADAERLIEHDADPAAEAL